ncbi:MAG TPA: RNA 2',3'-cyclic phosphodiesterase [Chthonomonadaceae bacterium]|nr:RNA 2',3'-cyclic phosphodiesterase [Chthonomonadaceae bacterium]
MRLFFAVLLTEEAREAVRRAQQALRASAGEKGIKWVTPEQFHYTLKFLGETPEERMLLAIEAARLTATQSAPFSFTLAGVGAFPQPRRPQVLWIGATEGVPLLAGLAESLDRNLAERGFAAETRRFSPHLTLARVKSPEGQEAIAKALSAQVAELNSVDKFGVIPVESFVVMRSELRPGGPIYTVLETFALTRSGNGETRQ